MLSTEQKADAAYAYAVCALWSSHTDDGGEMDSVYTLGDIEPTSRQAMTTDVINFIDGCESQRPDVFDVIEPSQAGHDFWLTRNHHGAGFWDRGLGERGTWLTDQCRPYGEATLYVGDDDQLYYEG